MSLANTSLSGGRPVELYKFVQGTDITAYCDRETVESQPIVHESVNYIPEAVKRSSLTRSEDLFKSPLTVQLPRLNTFAQNFLGLPQELITTLTIFRGQYDPSLPGPFITTFKGRVVSGKATGKWIEIECESVYSSVRRPGLRKRFEVNCPHLLYGRPCGVDKNLYAQAVTVQTVISNTQVVINPALANDYLTGGMVDYLGSLRFITAHIGGTITMTRAVENPQIGDDLTVWPGCNRSVDHCQNKFNNFPNFGGCTYIPPRNPFDGSSIV